jgi:hypothetical protein
MSYTPATAADLSAAFPEFDDVEPDVVDYWLARAILDVGSNWLERDRVHGQVLLTAHYLTLAGKGDTPEARAITDGSAEFRSMRVGSLSLERFDKRASTPILTTRYGREFAILARKNVGGPRVLNAAGIGALGDGDRSQSPTYGWG